MGDSIAQGRVIPDSYMITKDSKRVITNLCISNKDKMRRYDFSSEKTLELDVPQHMRDKQVLATDEILRLTEYGLWIENHFGGHPQDIEFAIENNNIRILQSRPISTI